GGSGERGVQFHDAPFVGVELLVSGEGVGCGGGGLHRGLLSWGWGSVVGGGDVVGGQGQPDAGSLDAGGGLAGVGVDPAVDADLGAGAHDAGAVGELLGSDGLGGGGGGHGVLLGDWGGPRPRCGAGGLVAADAVGVECGGVVVAGVLNVFAVFDCGVDALGGHSDVGFQLL